MRVFTFVAMFFLLLGCATAAEPAAAGRGLPARERIDRGVVARPVDGGKVYVGWRLLGSDPAGIAFNVYRRTGSAAPVKLNAEPIRQTTDFVDAQAAAGSEHAWFVRAVAAGREGPASPEAAATPTEKALPYISLKLDGNHTFQKVGIADLDGDGRYDFVIKQPHDNIDPYEKYWKRSPGTYKLEAYRHDGRFLWRVDLGWAIEQGIWYSPYVVYDLDGDGKAEVAVKTGEGDPRGPDGRVETSPEYLSILEGATGKELARTDWISREIPGEKYNYNLSSRNQICIAYLDGKTPSLIIGRGTYTVIRLVAYQFRGGKLEKLWDWDNREEAGRGLWRGQGAHIMHAADVDGDGRDEVIVGSCVVDDNGNGLWTTGFGHPDFCFVGDIDPLRPGLEIFYGIEPGHKENTLCLADAKTGEVIWGLKEPTTHVGSDGMCADIDMQYPGSECHAADIGRERKYVKSWLFSAQGELLSDKKQGGFARPVYWDADLQRELIHGPQICDYNGGTHLPKLVGNVVAIADVLGDWREEIITSAPGELRIYTTTIPAMDRRVCLMQDPIYRIDLAVAFMGYWAAPMLSYDIASRSPGLNLSVPSGSLMPGASTPGEILVQAALNAPLKGKLTLASSQDGVVTPPTADVDVPAGKLSKVAFSISAPAVTGVPTERRSLAITARLDLGGRVLKSESTLPIGDLPEKGYPLVEAEDIAAQGGGKVQIRDDKVGASGKATSHWDKQGQWIEWKIAAPKAGRYQVAVRYCAEQDAVRDFKLDSAAPAGLDRVTFPSTGGLGGATNDWAHAFVRDAAGKPVEWTLDAGPHVIRMTNADGKPMNMDYLLLVPME
jgi:rhamnogalacturonan endolyase